MNFADLADELAPHHARAANHPLFYALRRGHALATFTEHHVWAVWDFMSLLTSLQHSLTCTTVPWSPRAGNDTARIVNELKLGEESDLDPDGGYASHLELYLRAMLDIGGDDGAMRRTLSWMHEQPDTHPLVLAVKAGAPVGALEFSATTFDIIESQSTPAIAGAFALGREELIPAMFRSVLAQGPSPLRYYLARHVELDGGPHGSLSRLLVSSVCKTDDDWQEARRAAIAAVSARIRLWDHTLVAISTERFK